MRTGQNRCQNPESKYDYRSVIPLITHSFIIERIHLIVEPNVTHSDSYSHSQTICLCCRVTIILEFDDFTHSAKFLLENYEKREVCIKQPESALKEGVRIGRSISQTAKAFAESTVTKLKVNEKYTDEYDAYCQKILSGTFEEPHWKLEYPFLLYQMGSGFSLLKVRFTWYNS